MRKGQSYSMHGTGGLAQLVSFIGKIVSSFKGTKDNSLGTPSPLGRLLEKRQVGQRYAPKLLCQLPRR
jgi:hypothetical protein